MNINNKISLLNTYQLMNIFNELMTKLEKIEISKKKIENKEDKKQDKNKK